MEELDLGKELQEFYEKNNSNKDLRGYSEVLKKSKKFFGVKFLEKHIVGDNIPLKTGGRFTRIHKDEDFIFSYLHSHLFIYKTYLLFTDGQTLKFVKVDYSNFLNLSLKKEKNVFDNLFICYGDFKSWDLNAGGVILTQIYNLIRGIVEIRIEAELKKLEKEEVIRLEQERLQEQQRKEKLNVSQNKILKELDKDGNGEVDVVEGNDFSLLLKKHQKSIIEIDRTYVQQFVKVSSYLKTKKNNVQLIFNSIKDTSNEKELNEYVGILKNEIQTYSLILFNSLNMIVSLVEDDMITFYEIHESFDKLNIFNSNWENEVSQKLSNIGDGLSNLMYSIEEMGQNIANEIGELSYVTEESNRMLSNQLQDIDSSLQTNNLLTGIQTYQMYKINKNTKGLRE